MLSRETLYDSITEVRDELVIEAMETKPAKSRVRWLKFGSIAAAAAVVVTLGVGTITGKGPRLPIGGNASEGGSGHDENSSIFMSYAGPVFPLTTVEGGDGLTAERTVTYDFSPWTPVWWSNQEEADSRTDLTEAERQDVLRQYNEWFPKGGYYQSSNDLLVNDSYTLTNPTGEDKTVTLLYPFVGGLYVISKHLPTLTADGETLDAALLTGQYSRIGSGVSGGLPSMSRMESWEDYKQILSDGTYQASVLEDWPDLSDIPVTVYEITDPWLAEGISGTNPTIHAGFELDYSKTNVLSYGFHGGSYDRNAGTMRQGFSAPTPPASGSSGEQAVYEREQDAIHYLIVLGDPISGFHLFGAYDGAPESTNYMEWGTEIGAELRQYDTDLETILRTLAEQRLWAYDESHPDFELYFGMIKDCLLDTGLLLDNPEERYDLHWLEELHFQAMNRVFYLEAQITIPAGRSVTVEASFLKEASFDFACSGTKNQGVYGYDLVTRLGTNLDFTVQTAAAVNTDGVEIVRQNFGFDWENGVNTVTLDPSVEHYYLEVRRIKET